MSSFNINLVLDKLKESNKRFSNENDFRQEMINVIEEVYPTAKTRTEYPTNFNINKTIDILVIMDNKYYPIELKYPTKEKKYATNEQCYKYLQDIERIETYRDNEPLFEKGYTVILTNDKSYKDEPRENSDYIEFSIHEGTIKTGVMNWRNESNKLNSKEYGKPITLKGSYPISWKEYSKLDEETFMYLVNEIDK